MLPAATNLLGAGAFLRLRRTRFAQAAAAWLPRYLWRHFGDAMDDIAVGGLGGLMLDASELFEQTSR